MLSYHNNILKIYNNPEIISKSQLLQEGRNLVFIYQNQSNQDVVVKFFKKPKLIKALIYGSFRKSKAYRSYLYASKLIELGVGTPKPLGFFEEKKMGLLKMSYYCSQFIAPDYTFRDLTLDFNIPDFEKIIRKFTQFTFNLHEKGVEFCDHSPGNTLIKKNDQGTYDFFLVDLNRMNFGQMSFEKRMKNFSRITKEPKIISIISDEYAIISNYDKDDIHQAIKDNVNQFQTKFQKKKAFKKKFFFWRKKK